MTEVTRRARTGDLDNFNPTRFRLTDTAIDFGIEEAKRIKDWPRLEAAVDEKIDEQRKFVAWWTVAVSPNKRRCSFRSETTNLSADRAEQETGISKLQVTRMRAKLADPDRYRVRLLGAGYRAAFLEIPDDVRGTTGTGENEWFTPVEYIERARSVLGEIDLDPATHEHAQQVVRATRYFTKEDNGLQHEWHGRVWLNPPYAQPWIAQFATKICEERLAGRVTAAIMLTHNYTDTSWFQQLAAIADAICFTRGRVKFYEPNGEIAAPTQGQAFFYFGDQVERFAIAFREVGFVVLPFNGEVHNAE
jgi:phage N-6-adenine-methyltransferase